MDKIQVQILNPSAIAEAEKMMVCAARLTQRGHKIHSLDDFLGLYDKSYSEATAKAMTALPHPTIQKFSVINIVVVGASRRFLAQITRHQNEVKFMSASLQYSDYSGEADFVIPYEVLKLGEKAINSFTDVCLTASEQYQQAVSEGLDNDTAGYFMPQSLRNTIIISATPFQWKHMIAQRVCRRNTSEVRYVMLKIWEQLKELNSVMFSGFGPFCMMPGGCQEGKMACGNPLPFSWEPSEILKEDFPLLGGES